MKIPSNSEINPVACDEMQQDWNELIYKDIYKDGFIDGAKWVRDVYYKKIGLDNIILGNCKKCSGILHMDSSRGVICCTICEYELFVK